MKYGIILHNYGDKVEKEAGFNIGDPIQSIALEKIYNEMNIEDAQIVKIQLCDIKSYEGEYVLLPMLSVAIGINFIPLPLSPKIIPVFISSHFASSEFSKEIIEYLKIYAPIGCRDEYSLNTMRKYGVPSYLSGCITIVFDKRKENKIEKGKKIYIVDVPELLEPNIPDEIVKTAIRETHLQPISLKTMTSLDAEELYKISKERLENYKQNAKIVISSRMHALVPCMAMGIPVIAVFQNISYRFSWLDKYIKLYSEEEFSDIDWNPPSIELENQKNRIKELVKTVIKDNYQKYSMLYDVSSYYENRKKALYGNRYYNILKAIKYENEQFTYIIWGCGLTGNLVYKIMQELYPKAHLIVAVDEFVEGEWHGVNIVKSNQLEQYTSSLVILATYSGRKQGYEMMKQLDRKESRDFIYLGTING